MLAIIAGNGELPRLIIEECQKDKKDFVLILVYNQANPDNYLDVVHYNIEIGYVSKALKILNEHKVKEVVFVGGINKPSFSKIKVDKKGAILLSKILANKVFGDNNVLSSVVNFFKKEGFKIIGAQDIIKNIVVKKGILTKIKPDNIDLDNIKIGQNALKITSNLDIGQSVAVQQKQIIAIEAIEGTSEMIKRCSYFSFKSTNKPVLVKMKKSGQNTKIDLPSIGTKTIIDLEKSNFAGIAIESGSTLIINQDKVIKLADEKGLFIISVK